MRVALYVHCFFPTHFYGTEAYALTLATELKAQGVEPVIVTATLAGEPAQPSLVEERVHDGLRVVSIDKNLFPNRSVRDSYEQPSLRALHERILRAVEPDAIHVCHLISHTTALLDVAGAMGIPVFATLTDFFGFCYTNRLEDDAGALCAGPDASRANCVACFLKLAAERPEARPLTRLAADPRWRGLVAKGLAHLGAKGGAAPLTVAGFTPNDLVARPGLLRDAMSVYREAIAPTRFLKGAYEKNGFPAPLRLAHFGVAVERAPKPPRLEGAPVRLGFIGQLSPHKGAHVLLDALRAAGRDNLSLTIWGPQDQDAAYSARLRAQAEGLPASFAGVVAREKLASVLAGLDYLVIPSTWYENSPLILLQALATHTPVIVSDVEGMTEFVTPGVDGFHVRRGDAVSLADTLRAVADDPALATRLSAMTAYEFTPADMARDALDMYRAYGLADRAPAAGASPAPASGAEAGFEGELGPWLAFNEAPENLAQTAPFPPQSLMRETSGLESEADFARHGVDIMRALQAAAPQPLNAYRSWLDFGVGAGRLARMFKGFAGDYVGLDVDPRMVEWTRRALPWVKGMATAPGRRLPGADARFDAVVSISVFTHLGRDDHQFYLAELARLARPGAVVMLTVHGERALARAMADPAVLALMDIPADELKAARRALADGDGFHFTPQYGHLTSDRYSYGVAFAGRRWIDSCWTRWFEIEAHVEGAIHDFQDLVVARRRA
ncbi:glycosyltransferase [Methylocella sp.]|uniref:glycosyltransferase n=1 Tax=Methylocella sp. TaxID=1978226 RepID=UPI003783B1DB